jgi:hypothetical protein
MRIMKNWSCSPIRVPGSGTVSSAVTASVLRYFTGAAAGALSRGMGGEVGTVDRERRLGGRRVGEERPDARQPLVAGRGCPRLRGPHVAGELGDGGPVKRS